MIRNLPRAPRRFPGGARVLVLLGLLFAPAIGSCSNPKRDVNLTVEGYLGAIQQRHHRALAIFWAPYRREVAGLSEAEAAERLESFRQRIETAHAGFEKAKQDGALTPDELGVALFRALGIGKGAYSVPLDAVFEEAGGMSIARARTRVITNLDGINLDGLPTGVRIYLMGFPFGRLERIAVGYEELNEQSLLGSVDIDWTVVKAGPGIASPTGWLIESLAPDPASAVEWVPGRRER